MEGSVDFLYFHKFLEKCPRHSQKLPSATKSKPSAKIENSENWHFSCKTCCWVYIFHSVYPILLSLSFIKVFMNSQIFLYLKNPYSFLITVQEHAASSKTRGVEESAAVTTLERTQKVRTSKELKLTNDEWL